MKKIILVCLLGITMVFGVCMSACSKSHTHTLVKHEAVESTCDEDKPQGQTEYWSCEECGKFFADDQGTTEIEENSWLLKRPEHNFQQSGAVIKPATCSERGRARYVCTVCGAAEERELAMVSHHMTKFKAEQPTCEDPGNREYWYCDLCKKSYDDEQGTNVLTDAQIVRQPLGHQFPSKGQIIEEATCGHEGTEGFYCTRPGDTDHYEDRPIPKTAHDPEHTVHETRVESTICSEEGHIEYWYCPDCDQYFNDASMSDESIVEDVSLPKGPHPDGKLTYYPENSEATCANPAMKAHWECEECHHGYLIEVDGEKVNVDREDVIIGDIPKCDTTNPETFKHHDRIGERCDTPGIESHWECELCGRLYLQDPDGEYYEVQAEQLAIAAKHSIDPNDPQHTDPTCTEVGYETHFECKRCNKWFSDSNGLHEVQPDEIEIEATGHSFDKNKLVYNDTQHWHPATCGHTEERDGVEDHTMEYGVCTNPLCGYRIPYTYGLVFEEIKGDGDAVIAYAVSEFNPDNVNIGEVEQIVIPETYNNKPVTIISANVFAECTGLISVVIPKNVVTIEANAFGEFDAFETVYYGGENETAFGEINLSNSNGILTSAAKIYYAGEEPNPEAGKSYWYYEDFLPHVWDNLDDGHTLGLEYVLTNYDTEYMVKSIGRAGNVTKLVIPSTYKGKDVTEIAAEAFVNKANLQEVVIPDSVVVLGASAFKLCRNITKLTIGNGIDYLPDDAFNAAASLNTIFLGTGVTGIGKRAFYSNSLRSNPITVYYMSNDTVKYYAISGIDYFGDAMGDKVYFLSTEEPQVRGSWWHFDPDTGEVAIWPSLDWQVSDEGVLTKYLGDSQEVIVPDVYKEITIVSIGASAFKDNTTMTSVRLGNNVTSIGESAFEGAINLGRVEFTDNLTTIGNSAFKGCTALTSFNFRKVTSIGSNAFEGTSLVNFNASDVQVIGGNAFKDVATLKSITIHDGVITIAAGAFSGCTAVDYIVMTKSETISIAADAFAQSEGTVLYFDGTSTEWNVSKAKDNAVLAAMKRYYFAAAYPDVEDMYWHYSNDVPEVWEKMEQEPYTDGLTFTQNATGYTISGYTGTESNVVIPSYYQGQPVNEIAQNAFSSKTVITSITIPNSIKTIGSSAFMSCSNLDTIYIDVENITPSMAFYGCEKLRTVIFGDNVKTVGYGVFSNASYNKAYITKIVIGKNMQSINSSNFTSQYIGRNTQIYFHGTHDEYIQCSGIQNHSVLKGLTTYYYEEDQANVSGNDKWHYDGVNNPVKWN